MKFLERQPKTAAAFGTARTVQKQVRRFAIDPLGSKQMVEQRTFAVLERGDKPELKVGEGFEVLD